ncbi:DUF6354 family protein [Streptomyces lavenduligriseus]|uniref:DUF6354 family protein n=1 Tax=Streptomyces lavenduligriseus TaxID=67315 RepID=A0ABT0P5I0_9ACTN|nr:DUF6354 family protein [Streptomyces lavenduligriseus]MCL3998984.1 DUF6354 family protein [Streptomyces lavenduligriseus]
MAPDMVARERILRVTDVTRRTCVVERDKQGTAGRKTRPLALKRFATSAFKLIEDAVDEADQPLYARYRAAMTAVPGTSPSPMEDATAALRVHHEVIAEAAKIQD